MKQEVGIRMAISLVPTQPWMWQEMSSGSNCEVQGNSKNYILYSEYTFHVKYESVQIGEGITVYLI